MGLTIECQALNLKLANVSSTTIVSYFIFIYYCHIK
ncbi:MAG: hypothetical protein RLZZ546_157, partial [Bacteroidota bacterium]